MTVVRGCMIAAIALIAGAWAEAVRADEAYICEAGRVVYVKPGQLETMKRQDPCIANYFAATPPPPSAGAKTSSEVVLDSAVERPRTVEQHSDFRHVRIINASPGTEVWFQHRR